MSIEADLRRTILDKPDDDDARLVYADWLEENGDLARAEFIRIQIERNRLPWWREEHDWLEPRETKLLEDNCEQWLSELPDWAQEHAAFERGFVDQVFGQALQWQQDSERILAVAPVRSLRLRKGRGRLFRSLLATDTSELLTGLRLESLSLEANDFSPLAVMACLRGLRKLEIINCRLSPNVIDGFRRARSWEAVRHLEVFLSDIGNHRAAELLRCPALSALEHLHLVNNNLTGDTFLSALLERGEHLRSLDLSANPLGDEGLVRLAREGSFEQLEHLELRQMRGQGEGVGALGQAKWCRSLVSLDLQTNHMELGTVEGLAQSSYLRSLKSLDLRQTAIHDGRVTPLIDSPVLRSLEHLRLSENPLHDATVAGLLRSPHLGNLRSLDLDHLAVGSATMEALADSSHLSNLRRLNISFCGCSPEDLVALARSPNLSNLRVLDLRGVGVTGDLARSLTTSTYLGQLCAMWVTQGLLQGEARQILEARFGDQLRSESS